jgi:hypothetical protein
MILLAVFLAPSFLQARTLDWERVSVRWSSAESGFFSMVWSLLTDSYENGARVSPRRTGTNKNGGMVDPSGTPAPGGGNTATTGDNGGMVDPSGGK